MSLTRPGLRWGAPLTPDAQQALAEALAQVLETAPPYRPTLPRTGTPMRLHMSNCGPLGWVTDKAGGYRYQPLHPQTGRPWPPMPSQLLEIWEAAARYRAPPQACLINLYAWESRLGLHVDADEQDADAPVVSVSLGASARFRIGGPGRSDPTRSFLLRAGSVLVLEGEARRCRHGVDRIVPDGPGLWPHAARVNVTLRRVTPPE